ncbi:MAG: alpha/beta fold hydrolase [Anaerolineales bacterium]|nr:alpha/beta fold hydrolase [Anaerolineales bacterium]
MKDLLFLRGLAIGAALALALAACSTAVLPATTPRLPLEDCVLDGDVKAQCGEWAVPEDRTATTGKTITLKVVVVPAISRNAQPDALFLFAGGPGQAATEAFPPLLGALERIQQDRDLVLIDQRGTGENNPLTCPDSDDDVTLTLTEDETKKLYLESLRECLTQMAGDPRWYTTENAARDFDEVRAALGYEQINIYGVSYGTRMAQTYLKLFPERVRAVILDGVVPQAEALGIDVAADAQRALEMIFTRCEADEACRAAFPNLRAEFESVLTTLQAEAPIITAIHPTTGQATELRLTRSSTVSTIRLLTYAPETAALLPLLIHQAAQKNYTMLAAQMVAVGDDLSASISGTLNASVLCAEDAPFITPEQAAQANANTYLGDVQTAQIETLCAVWPHGPVSGDFKQPVQSSVPVLLLSGEADPVTPPSNAEEVARTLPNSLHVVAPGQGHNVLMRGCLPRVAANFIEAASVQGLDVACVQAIAPLPFFVDVTGPKP